MRDMKGRGKMLKIKKMELSDKNAFECFVDRYKAECGAEVLPFGLNPNNLPYEVFFDQITQLSDKDTLPAGWVKTIYYLLWNDDEIIGALNVRCEDSEFVLNHAGHIGYAIAPWKRKQGYASAALNMLLPIVKSFGINRVLLTCDIDNEASKRVIIKNGGRFDHRNDTKEFYWIKLTKC